MKYQTIEGESLTKDEFKKYIVEVLRHVSKNEDFFYGQFFFDLRRKCDMTMDEFLEIVREINLEQIDSKNGNGVK